MSWGVDIEVSHDDGYVTNIEVVDGHTYNLTPMWTKTGVIGSTTSDLDGALASDLAPRLLAGLIDIWTNEAAYRELDPPNGWGDFEGFVEIYTRLTRLCHQHPKGVLRWNG